MTLKYHILLINSDYEVEILFTTCLQASAHQYMSDYLKSKDIDGIHQKAYFEDERTIAIYNYHFIFSKTLAFKIILVEYNDNVIENYTAHKNFIIDGIECVNQSLAM